MAWVRCPLNYQLNFAVALTIRSSKIRSTGCLLRIHGQPSTFNLQPSTFNLQPSTFNLQPSTFNLQPSSSPYN
ncbi:hypothetical protein [Moorena producens]|uniref:hypothetical protein n=1 Tax=Moorena producens TaxID=1155739 RepID=UPI00096A67FF|nr:hypothetical protein [Moorena producens]